MTTAELIEKLKKVEMQHGVLPVYLEAKCTGANLMDVGGNVIDCYTISPLLEKCEVDCLEGGTVKAIWMTGSVAAPLEPAADDENDDPENGET